MKFVKVEHNRCDEFDGIDYYVAPNEMSDEEIEVLIQTARQNYLNILDAIKNENPLPLYPETRVEYISDDNITVGELKKKIKEYEDAKDKHIQLSKNASFVEQMKLVGLEHYKNYLHSLQLPEHTVYWGHKHGQKLKYFYQSIEEQTKLTGRTINIGVAKEE